MDWSCTPVSQVLKVFHPAGKCRPTPLRQWGTKTGSATGHSTPGALEAGVASVLLSGPRAAISSEDRVRTPLVHQCHLVSHHCHNARLQASFFDPEDVITQQSSITKPRCNTPGIPPPMAPAKAARNGAHDDSKSETPNTKEKNGGAGAHHSNGKLRRVASSTGSNLREVTNAGAIAGPTLAPSGAAASSEQQAVNPGVRHAPSPASCPMLCLTAFSSTTAPMACVSSRRPSRIPPSVPPQHTDRLQERRPPVDSHPAWEHRALLPDDRTAQGTAKTEQGPAHEYSTEAL